MTNALLILPIIGLVLCIIFALLIWTVIRDAFDRKFARDFDAALYGERE